MRPRAFTRETRFSSLPTPGPTSSRYRPVLLGLSKEIDEAGYVFGLGPMGVLRRILIPLLKPATLYAWIWMALLSYRELTLAAFLTAKDNQTLPTFILSFVVRGEAPIAAALSLFLIAFMAPLVLLYFVFGRRTFQLGG